MNAHKEAVERVAWAMREASDQSGLELTYDACEPLARAAIEALATQWQPIATAPKDGTWIIIGAANLYPSDAQWVQYDSCEGWHDSAGFFATQPTHWTRMPEVPK